MATVLLLGTLDTKGAEYQFVRDQLHERGVETLLIDAGVLAEPTLAPDVTATQVAAAGGVELTELRRRNDRGEAMAVMASGAATIVARLHSEGRFDGVLALGGTGGTALAAAAMRGLALGVPKVIVSTAASGDTRGYVGETDTVLFPSITDIAGVNRLSARILANACAAVAGMVLAPTPAVSTTAAMVGASMFGVTTPCVTRGRELLETAGYEVLVFHMTGVGGRTLEQLVRDGWLAGVLDVTTTELADELVGGVFSAGSGRLTGAAAAGVPQVVSVGALDMVNFGPRETVPAEFADRRFYVHNAGVTLMRTTAAECAELGRRVAQRLSQSTAPAALFLPLRGVSGLAINGGPFHDPQADDALFENIRAELDRSRVELVELDLEVNDPRFAEAMVEKLSGYLSH